MIKSKTSKSIISAALLMISLIVWLKVSAHSSDSDVTFQQSQSVSITMGVRDKYGTLGSYKALFVIHDGKGNKVEKPVSSKENNAANMNYPEDVDAFPAKWAFDGNYKWICKVNKRVVAKGKFVISNSTHEQQVRTIDPF